MCAYPKIETAFVPFFTHNISLGSSSLSPALSPALSLLHSLLSLSSLFSFLCSSLLFSCTGFVGVPWLKCSQTVIGSFVLALLPFSDFLFHFTFCFSFLFFPFFQCICCCCMKVGQGNAGAALELIGLGSLCGTDSCRRRYGKQKVCPRRSQVRTKKILCNR